MCKKVLAKDKSYEHLKKCEKIKGIDADVRDLKNEDTRS